MEKICRQIHEGMISSCASIPGKVQMENHMSMRIQDLPVLRMDFRLTLKTDPARLVEQLKDTGIDVRVRPMR